MRPAVPSAVRNRKCGVRTVAALALACAWLAIAAAQAPPSPSSNSPYFSLGSPGRLPAPFAPQVPESLRMTRSPVFVDGGRQAFWSSSVGTTSGRIVSARAAANGWTRAEALPFSTGAFFDHNPAPSQDGRRLVFASNRPVPGKAPTTIPGTSVPTSDLWFTEHTATGWSEPVPLSQAINTEADEDIPVLAADGTLYFGSSRPGGPGPASIYRSRLVNGRYGPPERLPAPITTGAGEMFNFVAPDQSCLIYLSFQAGEAGGMRVSFRAADGGWAASAPIAGELARFRPYFLTLSPDGAVLFFTSKPKDGPAQVYWVDAKTGGLAR